MLFIIGYTGALVIALIAYRFRALTISGALAATLVGGCIYLGGEVSGAIILVAFFISGSMLSRINHPPAPSFEMKVSHARDYKQVLANGIVPAVAMLVMYIKPSTREEMTLLFLGSLATATADTWATEIGTRFSTRVYDIISFKQMQPGLSGGITMIGTIASALGAFAIAALSLIHPQEAAGLCHLEFTPVLLVVTVAGFSGALIDSVIGAKLQAKYKLPDGHIIEDKHSGAALTSGTPLIGNNATNLMATFLGGLVAVGIAGWF
ncbi:MAG TPA: DUF92 domain-containing protein [Candidatus Kapabacteria bacterium]|nr:DUF92 domain-containing protein [Candidatus Kapabacteria bacterium]